MQLIFLLIIIFLGAVTGMLAGWMEVDRSLLGVLVLAILAVFAGVLLSNQEP